MTIRQYKMLTLFKKQSFTIPEALTLNQHTFGSLCRHGWVDYEIRGGGFFIITPKGFEALENLHHIDLHRMHNNGRFSMFVKIARRNIVKFRKRRVA